MANFSAIAGTDAHGVSSGLLYEIVNGVNERWQALGYPGQAIALAAGTDVQAASFWSYIQQWVDVRCLEFVNHTANEGAGGFDGEASVPLYASVAEFRSAAGLNASGWRRVPGEWDPPALPTFEYGYCEEDDIILNGFWMWDDLQKALIAMAYTTALCNASDRDRRAASGESVAELASNWSAAPWSAWTFGDGVEYRADAWVQTAVDEDGDDGLLSATRYRCLLEQHIVPTPVACAIDTYFDMTAVGTFTDLDSLGATEGNLHYHETWPAATAATRGGAGEATWFGDYDANPATLSTLDPETEARQGIQGDARLVFRWDFTHSGQPT
jgi:hypothetical protein